MSGSFAAGVAVAQVAVPEAQRPSILGGGAFVAPVPASAPAPSPARSWKRSDGSTGAAKPSAPKVVQEAENWQSKNLKSTVCFINSLYLLNLFSI